MSRFLLAALVAGLLCPLPRPALAKDSPSKAESKKANAHFKAGVQYIADGEHAKALAEFEEAYRIAPHPLVLFNIAGAHRQLKNYREALNAYSQFVLDGDGVVSFELLERGKSDMQELLSLVARVSVDSHPQGARIVVDGKDVGRTPLAERLILSPGPHELRAELDGHESIARKMNLAPGDSLELSLDMPPVEVAVGDTSGSDIEGTGAAPSAFERSFRASAGFGTNTLDIKNTGAPTLGVYFDLSERVTVGAEGVLIAFSFMPQIQVHLLTGHTQLSAVGSAVLSSSGGDEPEIFFAGAGGLRLRQSLSDRFALYGAVLASYAGSEYGLSIPAFVGGELLL